jgi:hypothetical protein
MSPEDRQTPFRPPSAGSAPFLGRPRQNSETSRLRTDAIAAIAFLIGCGGSTGTTVTTGVHGDAGGASADAPVLPATADAAGDTAALIACPIAQPAPDSACSTTLLCSWGDHPLTSCRSRGVCAKGKWSITPPPPVCAMNPPECPATRPSGICTAASKFWCLYDRQISCTCTACCNAPGCSAFCDKEPQGTVVWTCEGPPPLGAGCPPVVPNQGAPCNAPPTLGCPSLNCGLVVTCMNGVWTYGGNANCPGS